MNTNIKLETTDEERLKIGQTLYGKDKMVSRAGLREAINDYIQSLIEGRGNSEAPRPSSEAPADDDRGREERRGTRRLGDFVPSRGDEPYLYKPKDPEFAAVCSSILDACERLEELTWEKLEENRAT